MNKVEEKAQKTYPAWRNGIGDWFSQNSAYYGFIEGYHQAEEDIKEELSNLFQEFMLDCINDDTETHILHFIDVFNNKIKTIGNE